MKKFLLYLMTVVYVFSVSGCRANLWREVKEYATQKKDFQGAFEEWCSNGNIELIEEILENNKLQQITLNDGLYSASDVQSGNYAIMKMLLDAGADPNHEDMLYKFADKGKLESITILAGAENLDMEKRTSLNHSPLAVASMDDSGRAYDMCKILVENGAEIYSEMFECIPENDMFHAPKAKKMLANKYIENGGKFDFPDTYVYALCGDIPNAVKSAEKDKDKITESEMYLILDYSKRFGTVEEYKKLKEIYNIKDYKKDENGFHRTDISVQSIEMIEYILEINGEHIKFNPETDTDDDGYMNRDYQNISNAFHLAIASGNYDVCKYFIDNGVKPYSTLSSYGAMSAAMGCEDYEIFRLVYDYIKEEYGDFTEELLGWCYRPRNYLDEISDCQKKIFDFLLEEGYTFENVYYYFINDSISEYLISHGAAITDKIVYNIAENNNKNALKAVIDRGYKISPELFTDVIKFISSDMAEMILDSGTEMEENILIEGRLASKATVKLLIDRGANLKPVIDDDYIFQYGYSGNPKNFDLKDLYNKYCRDDLVELLEEYE